jgi:hypothetical protein
MKIEKLRKSFYSKWISSKIQIKNILKKRYTKSFYFCDKLEEDIINKHKIVVVCSGPSAKKLEPTSDAFYLTTNESYKLVKNYQFLYYVNDGYFFRRYLANSPLCSNHKSSLFFYRKEDPLHGRGFKYFKENLNLIKGSNYLISDFESEIAFSNLNYKDFISTLTKYKIPIKIQNSGIFLLLFGFYLSVKFDKELSIYGLDLGVGGNVHFEKGGHVGKSITSDRVKINTEKQLNTIYDLLKERIHNHSNFNPKV